VAGGAGRGRIRQHEERRAVIDAGGIAGRDAAVGLERRPHLGERFERGARLDVLIRIEGDVALAGLLDDGDDLRLEPPSAIAAAARRCDSTASSSCCWRVMPHLAVRFSAVMPMWPTPNGSVSVDTIRSIILASPMRAPLRIAGDI
jgi:hypothetical protein